MTIVESGARGDLGQGAEARRMLAAGRRSTSGPPVALRGPVARLRYAYAEALLERRRRGRRARLVRRMRRSWTPSVRLDAQERVDELDGLMIEFDEGPRTTPRSVEDGGRGDPTGHTRAGRDHRTTPRELADRQLRRCALRPRRRGLPRARRGARAAEGIAELRGRGIQVGFVTNNAARPPRAVAEHCVELGIPADRRRRGHLGPGGRASGA